MTWRAEGLRQQLQHVARKVTHGIFRRAWDLFSGVRSSSLYLGKNTGACRWSNGWWWRVFLWEECHNLEAAGRAQYSVWKALFRVCSDMELFGEQPGGEDQCGASLESASGWRVQAAVRCG